MKHAIFAATGAAGKAIASELAGMGMPFRVVGRSEARLRKDAQAAWPVSPDSPGSG
ncbi:MAG: hypothetical protein H7039_04055 [Bryobacteraceae bacterium]|nr:hypothetical protein [Bryobacteraceae bacterium]